MKFDGDILVLNQLRYDSQIRDIKGLNLPKNFDVKEKELDLAMDLIDNMTEKFEPGEFKDDYIDSLKKIIQAKSKNKTVKVNKEGSAQPKATDMNELMESLKKSLESVKAK